MRVVLLCQVATEATRQARFPADDAPDAERLGRVAPGCPALPRADLVLASPARAALATAAALGLSPRVDTALRDLDPGRWAGRTLDDLQVAEPEAVAAWLADPVAAPHGGESVQNLLARVAGWLDAQTQGGSRSLLAVTHAAVIRAAVIHALGAPPASFWRLDVPPLAVARLTGTRGRWQMTALTPA